MFYYVGVCLTICLYVGMCFIVCLYVTILSLYYHYNSEWKLSRISGSAD